MEAIALPSKGSPSDTDARFTLDAAVHLLLELDDESTRRRWIERCVARFPSAELLPFLVAESERLLNADPHGKLRIAESLIVASELGAHTDFLALGRMATGDAFRVLGRYRESVDAMEEAGRLFLSIGDEVGWARTRTGWVWSSHNLGHGEAALAEVGRAHEILMRHGSADKAARLDNHAGWVNFELGRYDAALMHYDRARQIWEAGGAATEADVARVKMNTAMLLTQLGDFQAALVLYEEARVVCLRHGETVSVLRQEQNVANVYAAQGLFTRALRRYTATFAAYEKADLDNDAAIVAVRMVECYLSLNRSDEALAMAEETVQRFERLGTPTDAAKARIFRAIAQARLGENEWALETLDEAAATFAAAGLLPELALVTLQRARLHLDDEDWLVALEEAGRASALLAEKGLVIRQAQADLVRARAALALGDDPGAETLAASVLALSDKLDIAWLAHEAHHLLGGIARARGDQPAALAAYDRSVRAIDRVQSVLAMELRSNFLADKLQVYGDAIVTSLRLSRPELAFSYLERAKSRALVDYLASNLEIQINIGDGASPELLDTLARLREEHNGLYNRLYGYAFSQHDQSVVRDDDALRAAIRDRERQIGRVLERLALDRTEDLVLARPGDAATHEIPHVAPGTVLLEYFFREDGGVAFVVSSGRMSVVPLDARPQDIGRLLHQWSLNLSATARAVASDVSLEELGQNARGILASLYRALITPVAAHLAGCERLVVIPYGPTHAIPFHALFDGERYLLETIEVSACPSSDLLRLCEASADSAARSALVVGHTDGGRLPAVLDEARDIAALLPGTCYLEEAASRSAVIAAAPHHRVLHLAAHGEARLDNPAFAHLKLADGQLTVVDIFNLQLRGVLVTLSACETGRSVVTGGDEVIGLSRGFLYAGASTIVQSLWRVEDGSTATLMRRFYRELRDGAAKGTALRNAQRALLDTKGVHPFFWAPFQLIGDGGP